jgi:hypothetical protein
MKIVKGERLWRVGRSAGRSVFVSVDSRLDVGLE